MAEALADEQIHGYSDVSRPCFFNVITCIVLK